MDPRFDGYFQAGVADSSSISTTNGSGSNEDQVYLVKVEKQPLFLAAGGPKLGVYPQLQSGSLEVRIVVSLMRAFPSERQPKSVSVSSGTQWVAPTF